MAQKNKPFIVKTKRQALLPIPAHELGVIFFGLKIKHINGVKKY